MSDRARKGLRWAFVVVAGLFGALVAGAPVWVSLARLFGA